MNQYVAALLRQRAIHTSCTLPFFSNTLHTACNLLASLDKVGNLFGERIYHNH